MSEYLDNIDNDIAEKHLLKHPFYLAWARGELSKEALTDYSQQYYHHVAAFPTYLSAVHANCDDQGTRKQLLNNLIDEEAGSPNHPELWKKFAGSLGVEEAQLTQTEKQPETENLINTFRSVCKQRSTAEGLRHFTHTRAKFRQSVNPKSMDSRSITDSPNPSIMSISLSISKQTAGIPLPSVKCWVVILTPIISNR